MADINSVIVKITEALDEAYAAAGLPNQTAQIVALTSDVATRTTERDNALTLAASRRTAIDAMKAKIEEANAADVAEHAADTAGDTARAQALTLANAAP